MLNKVDIGCCTSVGNPGYGAVLTLTPFKGLSTVTLTLSSPSSTPFTLITSVPAPLTSAPIVFKKFATSTTCGSLATFSNIVVPSAIVAAIITFIVAPTETTSKKILAACKFSALTLTAPSSITTSAPNASKPFKC